MLWYPRIIKKQDSYLKRFFVLLLLISFDLNAQTEGLHTEKLEQLSFYNQDQIISSLEQELYQMQIAISGIIFIGFICLVYSNQKRTSITQKKEQLEKENAFKEHILQIISHDLRNPALAFLEITKNVNYLLAKQDYKTINRMGHYIEEEAIALNKIIDNLLKWSLVQKELIPYQPDRIVVANLVDNVFAIFGHLASKKRITLVANIPRTLHIYADIDSLTIILRNLVDNAIKYTHEGGRIEINALLGNDGVSIQVSDTGVGMPEEKLQNIFLLEKNKSEQGTNAEKGIGLGLHLIYKLVQLNKGVVNVVSQLGKGTTFDVFLPTNV